MSINPSSSLSFNGVVSGLNTTSMVQALMSLDQAPLRQLQNQQSDISSRNNAYQKLQTQVQGFQSSLQKLLTPSNVNSKTVSSATSSVASATANANAINGTFSLNVSRLATATSVSSTNPMSAGIQPGNVLASAGLSITPSAGTVTINGVQITVSATDTLQGVLNKITDSTAGGSGVNTGVQATLVNDANGNPNYIKLTPIAGNTNPVQLGSASDTSNFLTATDLVATGVSGGGNAGAVQSGQPLSTTSMSGALSGDHFQAGALSSGGTLTINGSTTVQWSASDSMSTVLNRINSSGAGVTAAYDPLSDKVTFSNQATGNQAVSLSEATNGGGVGLLQAFGLSSATQQFGQTAAYTITQNGVTGPTQYSNSNSVTDIVPGVSATLTGTGSTNLSVTQDTSTTVDNVNAFVTQYNQLVDLIDKDTAYNSTTKSAGILMGDSSVQNLEDQVRSLVSAAAPGVGGTYTTLASLGISTGAYGSAVGSTNHLQLDESKLTTALQTNPQAVLNVLTGTRTANINPDTSGNPQPGTWISGVTGTPTGNQYGKYQLTVDSTGAVTSIYTPTGGTALAAVTGTVTAGGSLSSIIPGVTLAAGALPAAGSTFTDTVQVGQSGVLGRLDSYLSGVLGTTGMFQTETTNSGNELTDIGKQISDMNDRLAATQASLQQQFTAMESALAQLQGQGSSLLSALGSGSALPAPSSGSSSSGG